MEWQVRGVRDRLIGEPAGRIEVLVQERGPRSRQPHDGHELRVGVRRQRLEPVDVPASPRLTTEGANHP